MEQSDNPVIAAILRRRSVSPRRLSAPGPDDSQLSLIVEAGAAAPDHGRLKPWRFLHVSNRSALEKAFREAALEADPDAIGEGLKREAEKAHHAPCLVAVVARIDEASAIAPEIEQWVSVGAAIQNILLAAEALGFHAMIVSGKKVRTKSIRRAFGISDREYLVGFVAIGTSTPPASTQERQFPKELFTVWKPA